MHGIFGDPEFWRLAFGGLVNLLAGTALLCVRRWMRNSDRDRAEHKREIEAKLAAVVSPDVHSRSAAAGKSDHLDRPANSGHHRGNGGIRD